MTAGGRPVGNGACSWSKCVDLVEMRGLARTTLALLPGPEHEALRRRILRRLSGFAHALHASLRSDDPVEAATPWLPGEESSSLATHPSAADAALRYLTVDLGRALKA